MPETDDYALTAASAEAVTAPELDYRPSLPPEPRPRIGLVGCGGITRSHLQAYTKAGLEVVGFHDLDRARAVERRDAFYPDARVHEDLDQLLADPAIAVVDIATHPGPRAELIRRAIRAGKHVLSQKPFVTDLAVGRELAALAREHGVRLAVNQNGRWAPHVAWMRSAIAQGLIGEVTSLTATVAWNHNWTAGTPFDRIPHLVLYDFAIHWFDMVNCYLPGRTAQRVFASVRRLPGQEARPPLGAAVVIEFEQAVVTLHFDANCRQGPRDTTLIVGTRGSLRSEGPSLGEQRVTLSTAAGAASPELEGSWFPDGMVGTMGELLCAIHQQREPRNGAEDNLTSLALAFAAMASAERGAPVAVGEATTLEERWLAYPE